MHIIIYIVYLIWGYIIYPFVFIAFMLAALYDRKNKIFYFSKIGLAYPNNESGGQTIWIHASSTGRVSATRHLVNIMLERKYNVYISTTFRGAKRAKLLYGDSVNVFFLPIYNNFMIDKIIDHIGAEYVLMASLPYNPVFVSRLYKKSIPVYLINAYVKDKNTSSY